MDLDLNADQVALRDGIRALLAGRFGPARVRAGFDRAVWDDLRDAGVWTLRVDGFGWADAAVVFEQLGEACVPGPLVASLLARDFTGRVAAAAGVAGCVEVPATGAPVFVEHLDALDALVVAGAAGLRVVDPASLDAERVARPLDPLTPVWRVARLPAGDAAGGPDDAAAWRRHGALLTAALLTGLAQRATGAAVAHARERVQFDRPIGSFQAVKHLCADMLVRTEVARAALYAAGAHCDDPDLPGLDRAVAAAKALAGEAAVENGRASTQVHGGMGYTWEADVHLGLKRAWLLDTHFGSAGARCDELAGLAGAPEPGAAVATATATTAAADSPRAVP